MWVLKVLLVLVLGKESVALNQVLWLKCHEPGQCSPGLWSDHVSEQCLTRSFARMPEALRFNEDSKLQKEEEGESEKN